MIFERRAYTLRPGALASFWEAQKRWNLSGAYGSIIAAHNLCYLESAIGPAEQVIELHRYESLEQWEGLASQVYKSMDPAYFEHVRPMLLRQESGIFGRCPFDDLTPLWAGGGLESPLNFDPQKIPGGEIHVIETIYDLYPGGVPFFWKAYREFTDTAPALARHQLMFMHNAMIGALNRVIQHRWFANAVDAMDYQNALSEDKAWQNCSDAFRIWVSAKTTALTRAAPIPFFRSMFEAR